jgi:hypothetical protein
MGLGPHEAAIQHGGLKQTMSELSNEQNGSVAVRLSMEVRRPELEQYAGRFVALDLDSDQVLADAETFAQLAVIVRQTGLRASIVRAPSPDELLLVGIG